MLSTRVSPKPLSTRVIYQGQSEAALSTSCIVYIGVVPVCPMRGRPELGLLMRGQSGARVTDQGSVRSLSVAQVRPVLLE